MHPIGSRARRSPARATIPILAVAVLSIAPRPAPAQSPPPHVSNSATGGTANASGPTPATSPQPEPQAQAALQAERQPQTPAPPEPSAPPPPFTAGWRDGFVVQSEKGDFRLQIGLLVHADGRFAAADDAETITDTFLLRRARPYLRGRFAQRFEFFVNPDFAGGVVVVQDAYLDTVFSPAVRVRVGKANRPFGLERLHSAANLLFFERALPTALVPNRDVGVQVLGDLRGGLVSYSAALMNGVPDGGSGDLDTADGKDLSGRVVVRPFTARADSPVRGLGFAMAGSRGRQTGAGALPSFRTPSLQQPFFAYSGASADGVRTRYSPQVFYYFRRIGAFGEYVRTHTPVARGSVRGDIDHEAWQVAASFVLTGEAATDSGTGIRPRAGFDFGAGGWGALQVAARYHVLLVDERAFALGLTAAGASRKAEGWTVGLNWYLTQHVKHVLNIERTVFDDGRAARSAENGIVFRTQVSF